MATKTKSLTSAEVAAQLVDAWFLDVLPSLIDGVGDVVDLTSALAEVAEVRKAEYIKTHGPIRAGDDLVDEMIAGESGYLLGLQVGLRVRHIREVR